MVKKNINSMLLPELKKEAKSRGLKYTGLKKAELLSLLKTGKSRKVSKGRKSRKVSKGRKSRKVSKGRKSRKVSKGRKSRKVSTGASSSKPSEYCYSIAGKNTNKDSIKKFIEKIYRNRKYSTYFTKAEELPFNIIVSVHKNLACIKLTSRAQKNIDRITHIHSKLTTKDLRDDTGILLSIPKEFTLEQFKWWEEGATKEGVTWTTLEHEGPYFTWIMEPYVVRKMPLLYDGQKIILNSEAEEAASFYAKRLISEKSGNISIILTKDKLFNENFWNDFRQILTPELRQTIRDFKKVKFTYFIKKLEIRDDQKIKIRKAVTSAEKKHDYGYAMVNGVKEPIANYAVEASSLFMGRGDNPMRGRIKRNIRPEEVTINIGKTAQIPKAPGGHKWQQVIHDQNLRWIASWKDPLMGGIKYIYIGAEGQFKGRSDLLKFEKARKLNTFLDQIRQKYQMSITSSNSIDKQLGTVIYLIDHYGIRVGGTNDDSTADTFGASTLLVSHVKELSKNSVTFEFLGKDSILFNKAMKVSPQVYSNIKEFMSGKKASNDLFDKISACDINNYLKSFDKDLTAKVFRTRLASNLMHKTLEGIKVKKSASADQKKKIFDEANAEIARVLNHQRNVSKKSLETVKKYKAELKKLITELRAKKKERKATAVIETRIQKKEDQIESKENTLNIAIATSRTNYIDPRLVVAWCKDNELDIPKVYTATMQKKFKWAIDSTSENWNYISTPLASSMTELEPKIEGVCSGKKTSGKRVSRKRKVSRKSASLKRRVKKKVSRKRKVTRKRKSASPKRRASFKKVSKKVRKASLKKVLKKKISDYDEGDVPLALLRK